jgi:hypothetical protein
VILTVGDSTENGRNTFKELRLPSDHRDWLRGTGIELGNCVINSHIQQNTFIDSDIGVWSQQTATESSRPDPFYVEGNSFARLSNAGVNVFNSAVLGALTDNTFETIESVNRVSWRAVALVLDTEDHVKAQARVVRARRNRFVGNEIAISIRQYSKIAEETTSDFGTAAEPGMNVFRCNSPSNGNMKAFAGDVLIQAPPSSTPQVTLVGNDWDHSPVVPRGLASAKDGADLTIVDSAPSAPVDTSNARLASDVCPSGRTPGP